MNNETGFWRARNSPNDVATSKIIETISALDICARSGTDRLGILPLRTNCSHGRDYLTLTEAVSSGHVRVTEVSDQGRVSELSVANTGTRPVLVLDGEELIGAKQNRIVNLTILVPPCVSLNIPVSCVEAGRWAYVTHDLVPNGHAHHLYGRQMKLRHVSASLRTRQARHADQGAIWREIDEQLDVMGVHSSTGASAAMYLQRGHELDSLTKGVVAEEGDTGALFLYRNGIVGLELCDSPETWRRVLPHLLTSYGLDALNLSDPSFESGLDTSPTEFLSRVRRAKTQTYPAIGLGEDLRLKGRGISGAALSWEDRIVHLVVFSRCLERCASKAWQHYRPLAGVRFVSQSLKRFSKAWRTGMLET
jgi:hypothetical protein